jgi:hypothetical protein
MDYSLGPIHQKRGSFHTAYALPKSNNPARKVRYRLLDLMLTINRVQDVAAEPIERGHFAVVDLLREERAVFELPEDCPVEEVHGMVESTFAVRALHVSARLWVV